MSAKNLIPWGLSVVLGLSTLAMALSGQRDRELLDYYRDRAIRADVVMDTIQWQGHRYGGHKRLCPYCLENPHTPDCDLNNYIKSRGDLGNKLAAK